MDEKRDAEKKITVLINTLDMTEEKRDKFFAFLDSSGYFTSPASTCYHRNYEGGLADHSLNVCNLFTEMVQKLDLKGKVPYKTAIICSLFHDICKAGAYQKNGLGNFTYNPSHQNGHALLSLKILEDFFDLTDFEKSLITYHMGYYGTHESSPYGEYSLSQMKAANNDPITKLFHWCDDMESQFYK